MPATIDDVLVGTLGEANIGLAAGVAALNPLAAQLDAMIAFALGPLQADLSASLDAALGLSATLTLTATDPTALIRAALQAVIELQATLTAALSLPPIIFELGAEIGASVALSAALSVRLGLINALLEAAISIKIPAVRLAASLAAALNAGDVVLMSFDGISDPTDLQQIGSLIQSKFNTGIGGGAVGPTENVAGIIMVVTSPSVFASLGAIIQT